MKKTIVLIIMMLLPMFYLSAQNSTLSTGGEASGVGGSVSFSIGQIVVQYQAGDSLTFSEGVQQPYEISLNGVDNYPAIELHATVYPNPTQWNVTLSIIDIALIDKDLHTKLYDANGRFLSDVKVVSESTLIELSQYATGTYFLNVTDSKSQLKSFKIVKTK